MVKACRVAARIDALEAGNFPRQRLADVINE